MLEIPIALQNEGQKIIGVLHKPDVSTKKAVILVHGFTGDKNGPDDTFVRLANRLAENGIIAFRFDFRGSGESEGRFVDMTIAGEVSDLRRAIEFITKSYNVVGVVGESLGGTVSVLGYDYEISCMVLWYPAIYLRETESFRAMEEKKDELMAEGSIVARERDGITYRIGKDFFFERANLDIASNVRRIRCPLMIITGNNDSSVPHQQSERAIELVALPEAKRLEIIDGAAHCFRGARAEEWQEQAINLTVDWFNEWLK